jgi:Arc/MetJ-type ribon-helix-helix transcriptional regulator
MSEEKKQSRKFRSVSLPTGLLEAIDVLIEELRYWPSRSSFVREACLEKMRREENRLKELKASGNRLNLGD